MCGITGFWTRSSFDKKAYESTVLAMAEAIDFRGPDGQGSWCDVDAGIALAHRRLAIVDLSPAGHQPMVSASGRYVITFNGEVYNANRLRPHLEAKGYTFRGHSDTEIMLAAIEAYGLKEAVNQFIGMFAFALWDRHECTLHLVRDRVGVKPLYYGVVGNTLFFGSQLKSFYPHPHWNSHRRPQAVSELLTYNYIPGDMTIYKDVFKITPGTIITFDADFNRTTHTYWDMATISHETVIKSDSEHLDYLHDLLRDAVSLRCVSDVPLGAFLSGGVDSSLVVALMQEMSDRPVQTFTIGFKEDQFNEAHHAEAVAKHLGTHHRSFYLTAKDALNIIPTMGQYFDEPFADSSQIPTYLVSKMARQHVTVALSGDGGDEFFAGYTRHAMCSKIGNILSKVPTPIYRSLGPLLRHMANPRYESILSHLPLSHPSDKFLKLAELLHTKSQKNLFHGTYRLWQDEDLLAMTGHTPNHFNNVWKRCEDARPNFVEQMQLCDGLMYLPDDIMTKVDRASMAHSLEAREPLLDHRIIEYATTMPMHLKLYKGKGKIALKTILERYIPRELIHRPKQGFGVPIGAWLRGPLRDWAYDLLSSNALKDSGIVDSAPILTRLDEHMRGKRDWTYALWGILMYQDWNRHV